MDIILQCNKNNSTALVKIVETTLNQLNTLGKILYNNK